MTKATEGFAPVLGYRLFYRSFGDPGHPTVLGLHGGPGAIHDYLLPLADLAEDGYRVVLFDQLGCGKSDLPDDHGLFTLDHNVAEVEALRSVLRLGKIHLIGSSYGGLLALAYAIRWQKHLRSLITVGGVASIPLAQREMTRLKSELPAATRAVMEKHEAAGTFDAPEYVGAVLEFYRKHVCRVEPWPDELLRTMKMSGERPVYAEMNGPNEFTITGSIRDIDLTPQLPGIHVPTLVLGGRYDEVTPTVAKAIAGAVPGARRVEFVHSSHMPFWEERPLFRRTVVEFLRSVDSA
ncbi:MAG: proline iminopeptidase-family hydrolase [Thermoplasmata archaeon]|nr:proline iminopeptidase-family hydrolase [Thermoplasmata archaeon]